MSEISRPTPVALTRWLSRAWQALKGLILDRAESRVFRAALVTVLFVAAIQHFVGWKYAGVLAREIAAHVQQQVLPWSGSGEAFFRMTPGAPQVVVLQIGDDFFSGPNGEGFEHRVPLPPNGVLRLLTAVAEKAPAARIVIDFDLAPRAGVPEQERVLLDNWLVANAGRFVLVEPSWAVRDLDVLTRQLDWVAKLCRVGPYHPKDASDKSGAAVYAQSTLVSRFGLVADSLPYSGKTGPTWDIGRAVHDHVSNSKDGLKRNPICERVGLVAVGANFDPGPFASNPPAVLVLATELLALGSLRVEPQPVKPSSHPELYLRSEFIRDDSDCRPKNFEEVVKQPCLEKASVVVVGGTWSYGFGDRQDTFVGEQDGAIVHAAWIQSWLKPAPHLSHCFKICELALDAIIIEKLLHSILEFAFLGMHRRTEDYVTLLHSDKPSAGLGRHVTAMLGFLLLAVGAVIITVFSLIVIDGLLRWSFDMSLELDTAILALALWIVLAYNGLGTRMQAEPGHRRDSFPWGVALRLGIFCAVGVAAVYVLANVQSPSIVRAGVVIALLGVPGVFVLQKFMRPAVKHRKPPSRRLETLLKSFRCTFRASLAPFRRPSRVTVKDALGRLSDVFGVVMFVVIVGIGIWTALGGELRGLMLEILRGLMQ